MQSAAKVGLVMMLLIAATSGARAQDKAKEFEGLVKQVVKQIDDNFISRGRAPHADDVKKPVEEALKGKGFTERKTALLLERVVSALGKAALAEADAAKKELIQTASASVALFLSTSIKALFKVTRYTLVPLRA